MNEIVNFRTEIETKVDQSHENLIFYLESDLLFCEATEE
jgi:hypothetical protein